MKHIWYLALKKVSHVFKYYILISNLCDYVKADAFCGANDPLLNERLMYCYGLTAYCCGIRRGECCWDSIWKVWWFWLVILVILGSLFACLGYFCSCSNDESTVTYGVVRSSPFMNLRNSFRRTWTGETPDYEDEWKEYRERTVLLPPYYPSTSAVNLSEPSANTSAYPDPPPPYNGTSYDIHDIQPIEATSSLPVSTATTVLTTVAVANDQTTPITTSSNTITTSSITER